MKNIRIFYPKNCHILVVKFSVYLNRRVFVMVLFVLLCRYNSHHLSSHSKIMGISKGICEGKISIVYIKLLKTENN